MEYLKVQISSDNVFSRLTVLLRAFVNDYLHILRCVRCIQFIRCLRCIRCIYISITIIVNILIYNFNADNANFITLPHRSRVHLRRCSPGQK